MPQYRLVAMKGGRSAQYEFEAEDSFDATTTAIAEVLNRAMESKLWAKGRIELWQRGATKPLHVMEAKEE
jgi:hypothetical protein